MIIDIIIGVLFLVLFGFSLKGAYLTVCDKQKAWNDKNKSPPPGA
jgi:hypothetical protein|tara:strand:- start:706 stop:840 length:135 start_codon:yes stop_codon:yes gene_type:complete